MYLSHTIMGAYLTSRIPNFGFKLIEFLMSSYEKARIIDAHFLGVFFTFIFKNQYLSSNFSHRVTKLFSIASVFCQW